MVRTMNYLERHSISVAIINMVATGYIAYAVLPLFYDFVLFTAKILGVA